MQHNGRYMCMSCLCALSWLAKRNYSKLFRLLSILCSLMFWVCFGVCSFRMVPFLTELRAVMDWVWTDTSLSLSSWICVEDIYAHIFILKCWRESEKVFIIEDFFLRPESNPLNFSSCDFDSISKTANYMGCQFWNVNNKRPMLMRATLSFLCSLSVTSK